MKFGLQAKLQWCNVFGGTFKDFDDAAECRLLFAKDWYLLYLNFSHIDVVKHLNAAFGTRFEGTMVVEDAGFFTFSRLSARAEAKTLAQVFPDAPIPLAVGQQSVPLAECTSFWFSLNLKLSLFNGLLKIGDWDQGLPQTLALYAVLSNTATPGEAFSQGVYCLQLPDLELFRVFRFSRVELRYAFAKPGPPGGVTPSAAEASEEYRVSGTLAVSLFQYALTFSGELIVTRKRLDASLALQTGPSDIVPFDGKMKGFCFASLRFAVQHAFETQETLFSVNGSIDYGALHLSGKIHIRQGRPVLALAVLTGDLSLSEIFSLSVAGGAIFPAGMFDVTIKRDSLFYYSAPPPDSSAPPGGEPGASLPGTDYQAGFNLEANILFTIGATVIDIHGAVAIHDDSISAGIALAAPIRILDVLVLSGRTQTDGPTFALDTGSGAMSFTCTVTLLQAHFGVRIALSMSRTRTGNCLLQGRFRSTQSFSVLPQGSELAFSYSADDGFHITNWPRLDFPKAPFDVLKKIKAMAASSGGICGAMADFLSKDLLQCRFSASPAVKEKNGAAGITLNVSCAFFIRAHPLTSIDFDDVIWVTLPKDVSMDALLDLFVEAVESGAEGLVRCLLNDTEKMAAIIAYAGGKNAAKIAANLVCKGLVKAALAALTTAAADAVAALGEAALTIAGIVAVFEAIKKAHEKCCFVAGTRIALPGGATAAIETLTAGDVVLGQGGARNTVIRLYAPLLGNRKLYALNGGRFFVTAEHPFRTTAGWRSLSPAATGREMPGLPVEALVEGDVLERLEGRERVNAIACATADPLLAVYNLSLTGNRTYYADGYLVHNKEDPPVPEEYPDPPSHLANDLDKADLILRWDAMARATGYTIVVRGPDGRSSEQNLDYARTSIDLKPGDLAPGRYTWTVCSRKEKYRSAASAWDFTVLDPPACRAGYAYAENRLRISWDGVTKSLGYRAIVTPPAGEAVIAEYAASARTGFVDLPGPPVTGTWCVTMHSLGQSGAGVSVVSGPASPAVTVLVETPEAVCAEAFARHASGEDCVGLLRRSFSDISVARAAAAMASTGYPYADTLRGLVSAWPDVDPHCLLEALRAAYGRPSSLEELASFAFLLEMPGAACGQILHADFPRAAPPDVARAMAGAGYAYTQTGEGLKAAWPDITATDLLAALLEAYGKSSATLEEAARLAHEQGNTGAACGRLLHADFPRAAPPEVARAMAGAGYTYTQTGEGLKAAWPDITATDLLAALLKAYGAG